jgi:hypothetical protein
MIMNHLYTLCLLAAAGLKVVTFLHAYIMSSLRNDFRHPTIETFCKNSFWFPRGPPSKLEDYLREPICTGRSIERLNVSLKEHNATSGDSFMCKQCQIGPKLMKSLIEIHRKELNNLNDCDILQLLKRKFVTDLERFPNTIALSHAACEVSQKDLESPNALKKHMSVFEEKWVGFSTYICSPKYVIHCRFFSEIRSLNETGFTIKVHNC